MNDITNISVYYFSGTGNAKQLAMWLARFAAEKHIECRVFDIAKTPTADIAPLDADALIVFISPVHGFNFPKITLKFIEAFPKGKSRVVLMNTRAGMKIGRFITPGLTGVAFMLSSLLLTLKGYKIVGQIPFDMPSNWISIHPALNEKTVKFLHEKNYYRLEKHAEGLFAGKSDFYANRDLLQDVLIAPVSLGYYLAGRFFFAKTFYAAESCDNCGRCERQCPVGAIKPVGNRPYWTFKCESCMKCMNACPKNAIETAHGLMVAVAFAASLTLSFVVDNLLKTTIESGWFRGLLFTAVLLVLLGLFYNLQHLLLRNKRIARFISYLSLTHYRFWGRYISIPDEKWKK